MTSQDIPNPARGVTGLYRVERLPGGNITLTIKDSRTYTLGRDEAQLIGAALAEITTVPAAMLVLGGSPEFKDDPRWVYAELTPEQASRGWPCSVCGIRRDEHADQDLSGPFKSLDVTSHLFQFALDRVDAAG